MIRLILAIPALVSAVEIAGVDYSEDDKKGHVVLGVASGAVGLVILDRVEPDAPVWERMAVAVATSAVVGIAKEVSDAQDPKHHTVETADAVATITGGALVALTLSWSF